MTNQDHTEAFQAYIETTGITPPDTIIGDGQIHRFHMPDEKRNRKSGWYVYHSNGHYSHGVFGDWRSGSCHRWTAKNPTEMDPKERKYFERERRRLDCLRKEEEQRRQTEAARRAWNVWKAAEEADPDHDYLQAKGVDAYGLRQNHSGLLVPVTDVELGLHGIQYISKAGEKTFMPGTAKKGHFHALRCLTLDVVLVAEGYATAATLYEATGLPSVCAFDAGNLGSVCKAIHAFYHPPRIVVCGDNDRATDGNPGRTAAKRAAKAVGGKVAIPEFGNVAGSDWNDYGAIWGGAAVRECVEAVL